MVSVADPAFLLNLAFQRGVLSLCPHHLSSMQPTHFALLLQKWVHQATMRLSHPETSLLFFLHKAGLVEGGGGGGGRGGWGHWETGIYKLYFLYGLMQCYCYSPAVSEQWAADRAKRPDLETGQPPCVLSHPVSCSLVVGPSTPGSASRMLLTT